MKAEEILKKKGIYVGFSSTYTWDGIVAAMTEYANLVSEEKDKRIADLEARVNELTIDNMTHEYNQAESERFAPEFKRQIEEPLKERIVELEWDNESLIIEEARLKERIVELESNIKEIAETNNKLWVMGTMTQTELRNLKDSEPLTSEEGR